GLTFRFHERTDHLVRVVREPGSGKILSPRVEPTTNNVTSNIPGPTTGGHRRTEPSHPRVHDPAHERVELFLPCLSCETFHPFHRQPDPMISNSMIQVLRHVDPGGRVETVPT